jgi:hypothetical protein
MRTNTRPRDTLAARLATRATSAARRARVRRIATPHSSAHARAGRSHLRGRRRTKRGHGCGGGRASRAAALADQNRLAAHRQHQRGRDRDCPDLCTEGRRRQEGHAALSARRNQTRPGCTIRPPGLRASPAATVGGLGVGAIARARTQPEWPRRSRASAIEASHGHSRATRSIPPQSSSCGPARCVGARALPQAADASARTAPPWSSVAMRSRRLVDRPTSWISTRPAEVPTATRPGP